MAVAESCFPREMGARLDLKREDLGPDLLAEYLLFGEDASRIVISCVRDNVPRIKEVAVRYGVGALPIGVTQSENLEILVDERVVVSAPVSELKDSWEHALERALHTETEERLAPEILQKS